MIKGAGRGKRGPGKEETFVAGQLFLLCWFSEVCNLAEVLEFVHN